MLSGLARRILAGACLATVLAGGAAAADIPAPTSARYAGTLAVSVDATDLERKIYRVRQTIPARPGHLVLLYPQWVPGSHAPIGSIVQLTGLQLSAAGKPIAWTRDPVNMHAFHIDLPRGASAVEAQFEWTTPLQPAQGRVVMTPEMLHLQFDRVLLYPAGVHTDGITVAAEVKLPAGWQYATALQTAAREGDVVRFAPTDLTTLVDSPMMAARHVRTTPLTGDDMLPVRLNAFMEKEETTPPADKVIEPHRAMVPQALKMFGAPPYRHYDFLLAMGEGIGGIGREHTQSTEITLPANYFSDFPGASLREMVIPHEFVHVWVGKFRRPADLMTANYNVPMQNSLLWVYEGQTQLLGLVLEARAKFRPQETIRDVLALMAAGVEGKRGRQWRDLQDTVHDDIMGLRNVQRGWVNWQRTGGDYYNEGALLWLAADARIRSLSGEKKSLDDFLALFYADAPAAGQKPRAYRFEDVVATLNKVAPWDWAAWLRARLDGHDDLLIKEDLPLTGWQLVYRKKQNERQAKAARESGSCDAFYSLGFSVAKNETISNVQWDSPAFRAGITPGSTLLAVNGRVYKCSDLTDAINAADGKTKPIELIVKREREIKVLKFDYPDGLRYPQLERLPDVPDRLSRILDPR